MNRNRKVKRAMKEYTRKEIQELLDHPDQGDSPLGSTGSVVIRQLLGEIDMMLKVPPISEEELTPHQMYWRLRFAAIYALEGVRLGWDEERAEKKVRGLLEKGAASGVEITKFPWERR